MSSFDYKLVNKVVISSNSLRKRVASPKSSFYVRLVINRQKFLCKYYVKIHEFCLIL